MVVDRLGLEIAESTRRYLMIPMLRAARAILLVSAFIVAMQYYAWYLSQLHLLTQSVVMPGGFFIAVLIIEVHYAIEFYKFPSSLTVDFWASGTILLSVLAEFMAISAPFLYALQQSSIIALILYVIQISLFVSCVLVESVIHVYAYSDENRKKLVEEKKLRIPEFDPTIVLLDEIKRQKEKDRGGTSISQPESS